ncbi:DUF4383 domain-containing protein [Lolliginicoccus levis]|uniref:DUF4383 domain-containing protein n=1 Tax=Lolliginicoccus levis TaxID=2919542 RepID=UPI00241D970E|nr:DUF4383 domain-containing protein [Lolliginicoccus levis]
MVSHEAHHRPTNAFAPVQVGAAIVGAAFLLAGIAGFIPGVTSDFDTLQFAGHESEAALLGVFQVSILHNLVHLAFGVAGLALSRTASAARMYLLGGGVIYLLLAVYGAVIDYSSEANFVPLNTADNWLHLGLGLGMLALGLLLPRLGHHTPAGHSSATA